MKAKNPAISSTLSETELAGPNESNQRVPSIPQRFEGAVLAALPLLSFLLQFVFSARAGTLRIMLHHPTVALVDWIFVAFNYFVVRVIDWRRGMRLYALAALSVSMNVLVNALWQYQHLDPGHMIDKSGMVLPAGWVHLAFSTLEMILLAGFVFCRVSDHSDQLDQYTRWSTIAATAYFIAMGVSAFLIHGRIVPSDAITCAVGLFFVLIYPKIVE